ncbi:hypothetical protein [Streptomyces sp. NPDC048442]|uniref:hypothetical protein n=1 Tax=Streptomyces sp. NPDC048442 TaxID=3154823 RepID=UPI003417C06A
MRRLRLTEGARPEPPGDRPSFVAPLPGSNAIAVVLIVICTLAGAIAILLVLPAGIGVLGAATTIAGTGFALAAKIGVPHGR